MTTLAQQIDALRVRMLEAHNAEMEAIGRASSDLFARDAELMRQIEALLLDHQERRGDIARALASLAARIGYVPPVEAQPAPLQGQSPTAAPALGARPVYVPGPPARGVH